MNEDKLIQALKEIAEFACETLEDALPAVTEDQLLREYDLSCLTKSEREAFTRLLLKIERNQRNEPLSMIRMRP